MKKKSWIVILSSLLVLQIFNYWNTLAAQSKEVIVPQSLTTQTVVKENDSLAYVEEEEDVPLIPTLSFEKNPSAEFYQLNPDYVGWLTIENTVIDYPVVRGIDNDYYLHHNFYREEDLLGAIFMDYRNIGMGKDKHTIIYGHYAMYGQMFKDLDLYLTEDFFYNQSEFVFSDSYSDRTYKIFSVHASDADPRFIDVTFENDEFPTFIDTLKQESLFSTDIEVTSEDNILTLVTCNFDQYDNRLFIHAVEIEK